MRGHVYRRCPRPRPETCQRGRCQHRYAYTFSAGTDPTTGARRQYTRSGFETRKAAEAALRKAIGQAETGSLQLLRKQREAAVAAAEAAMHRPTVTAFFDEWLARGVGTHGVRWRPNTADGYEMLARVHIKPQIGAMPIADVTTIDLQRVLDSVAKPDPDGRLRTRATVAKVRATLTGAFKAAHRLGLIDRNPATDLIVTGSEQSHDIVVYTPDQLAQLLPAIEADRLGSLYYVDAFTGLRRGELVALQWPDIDLDHAVMTVRRSITQRAGKLRHGKPKSRKGERLVHLDVDTVDVLRRHQDRQAAERTAWGAAYQDHSLVWAHEDGTPLRPDYVTRHWHELTERAGLPKARLHDLRHTHASHALAAGVPTKVVSDRLGHSSTAFTERVYQHTAPAVAAEAAELIAALTKGAASKLASKPPSASE